MVETSKSTTKKQSNPFSTGGGGYSFERHVQAVFLLALLVDGFSPAMDCPIIRLEFQAKHLGYNTDDLVAITSGSYRHGKILCSIKNNIIATQNNNTFQEVITAAWNDYIREDFDPVLDRIALITGVTSKSSMDELRAIHEQAVAASDGNDFVRRIKQSNFTNKKTGARFDALCNCLNVAKRSELTEEELWDFCKTFLLIVFDGNYEGSIQEALCKSLIKLKSTADPILVWNSLVEYAGQCNQIARSVTKETIDPFIKELFKIPVKELPSSITPSKVWAQIALIGSWNENNEADQKAIEVITGTSFPAFLDFAREHLHEDNSRLFLSNGIWHVSYRKQLLSILKDYIYDDLISDAFQVASKVITERSKQFIDGKNVSHIMPADGWFANSSAFRHGLCEGLCFLANDMPLPNCSDRLVEIQSHGLIRNLFSNASWEILAGLKDLTQILAEMSPSAFLQELETFVVNRKSEFVKLIPPKERNSILDVDYLTQIRQAIVILAWIPDFFNRCISCLSNIELVGRTETNNDNIVIDDLISILHAFFPQTYASRGQKEHAILALQKDSHDVCWSVLRGLLPESSPLVIQTSKPKYIDITRSEREVSHKEKTEILQYYIKTAIDLSDDSPERMADLTPHITIMDQVTASSYVKQIQSMAIDWTDDMKYPVWSKLRNLRARILLNNEGKEPETEFFLRLKDAIDTTTPESKFYQYLYLFSNNNPEYLLDSSEKRWRKREEDRKEAVLDLYLSHGMDTVYQFGEKSGNLQDVGFKLGSKIDLIKMKFLLAEYNEDRESIIYQYVINGFLQTNGIKILQEMGLETYDESFRTKVLIAAPIVPDLFPLIDIYLSDSTSYWREVRLSWFHPSWPQETIEFVIKNLSKSGRNITIINALNLFVEGFNLQEELLETIMLEATSDQSGEKLNPHAVCEVIKKIQSYEKPNIEILSQIEFAYLPILGGTSDVQPRALYYKLSNESSFFCELMERVYKPHHEEKKTVNLPEEYVKRYVSLAYNFCVVPGVEWDGSFNPKHFCSWMVDTLRWAEETDRVEVVQHTIGNGLSYSQKVEGLPHEVILEVLNKPQNREMRYGYQLGIQNQRGVYWVDPEGKPELELANNYQNYAQNAEERGYIRVAEMMRSISDYYKHEAEENQKLLKYREHME